MPATNAQAIRKPELINATLECIARMGIDALTLDDVARQAGCSKGVAAYHFGTKQRLIIESLAAFLASYQTAIGAAGCRDASSYLEALINVSLPEWDSSANPDTEPAINAIARPTAPEIVIPPGKKARLFINFTARACQDPELRSILANQYARDAAGISQILAGAAHERGTELKQPDTEAYRFLALLYGLAFFRTCDFFPPGARDNRDILTNQFGGTP